MVSLDDAVIARFEKGGSRYEILVDPDLVAQWKDNPENVDFEEMLATDEVWSDARAGDRPTAEALQNIFGTTDLVPCVERILRDGSIQLTTMQRKKMVENKRKQIINAIATTATDPKTRSPHPPIRIEHALDEARFSVDPFLSVERQARLFRQVVMPRAETLLAEGDVLNLDLAEPAFQRLVDSIHPE